MAKRNDYYDSKIKREKDWYKNAKFENGHFLNSSALYSPERQWFNYCFIKKQMSKVINNAVEARHLKNPSILIAPVGIGSDIIHLAPISSDITGVDISEEAIGKITNGNVKKYVADIKTCAYLIIIALIYL